MGFWRGSLAVLALTSIAMVFVAVAWGSAASGSAATVAVTAGKPSELAFTLNKKSVAKGAVLFTVTNKGKLSHDFKIAGKRTTMVAPGKTVRMTVTFTKAGKFPYLCTVPGHAAAGMKGVLTIK
jgi:uncharacterized cupredoxin-like copper-binding protein